MCSSRFDPARSCRSSTFCVTSSSSPGHSASSRASARCAAFGLDRAQLRPPRIVEMHGPAPDRARTPRASRHPRPDAPPTARPARETSRARFRPTRRRRSGSRCCAVRGNPWRILRNRAGRLKLLPLVKVTPSGPDISVITKGLSGPCCVRGFVIRKILRSRLPAASAQRAAHPGGDRGWAYHAIA